MSTQSFIRHLKSKLIITPEEVEKRKEICNSCPERKNEFLTNIELCNRCGCVLSWKIPIASQSCPLKKWGSLKQV